MSLAVSVSLFHLVLRREGAPPPAKREGGEVRPRFHSLIAIGISLGFTVTSVILYCIIGTYQEWVSRWRWYTPVFYSSICLLVAVSFALQWVIAVVRACSWSCLKRLARVVLTLAVAALFSTSGVAYLGIKDKFEYVNTDLWLSWKLSRNARFFEGMYNMAFLKTARKIKGQETECINGIFGHAIAMTRDEVFGALTEDGKNVSPEIEIPSGKTVYYMEVVRPGNIHQSFLHVSRLEKLLWDGKRYRPTGREFALVVFEGKPDRFVAAIPVSNGRGEIQTAAETRWVGDVLLGRFQEAVYLNTITHQDFKPSE
jgi:hypothetical protein